MPGSKINPAQTVDEIDALCKQVMVKYNALMQLDHSIAENRHASTDALEKMEKLVDYCGHRRPHTT